MFQSVSDKELYGLPGGDQVDGLPPAASKPSLPKASGQDYTTNKTELVLNQKPGCTEGTNVMMSFDMRDVCASGIIPGCECEGC